MTELLPVIREPDQLERSLDRVEDAVRFAEIIAPTHFVPGGLRGKPDQILACFMLGREIGLGPMRSLSWITLVDGRPTLYAEGIRALILSRGHELKTIDWTKTRCVLAGRRVGSNEWQEVTFSMDDAKQAGLDKKPNWRAYPQDMLLARATGRLSRLIFADVLGGIGSAEEYADLNGSAPTATPSQADAEGGAAAPPKSTQRRRRSPTSPATTAAAPNPESLPPEPTPDTGGPASPAPADDPDRLDLLLDEQREAEKLENERKLIADLEASGATLVEEAETRAEQPEPITDEQRTKLHALFGDKGIESREAKLAYATRVAGRSVTSSNELTVAEASKVIDVLEAWDVESGMDPFAALPDDGIPY